MNKLSRVLYKLASPALRKLYRHSIAGKRLNGTRMKLYYNKGQHLGFLLQKEIVYEADIVRQILQVIRPEDLVFELGSNIGQYSLLISERIGDPGKLVCIEPDSNNFAFLSFNILQNQCDNVALIKGAIADKPGKTIFYKDTITGGRMGSLIKKYTGDKYTGRSEEVELWTLKQITEHFGHPQFVKIDVEGAEDLIFRDPTTIHTDTIYLIEVREETKKNIYDVFNSFGFNIYILEQNNKEATSASEIPAFANLLIKKGKM